MSLATRPMRTYLRASTWIRHSGLLVKGESFGDSDFGNKAPSAMHGGHGVTRALTHKSHKVGVASSY